MGQAGAGVPEVDLAYHGRAELTPGRLGVRLTPENHGPSDVSEATVRLRYSVPLTTGQRLPDACLRADQQVVLCRTGALRAGSRGKEIPVEVKLRGRPSEATVRIDTHWNGNATDHNPTNDHHTVLVLQTGDAYSF
ncbi:hypothetical protein GUY60_34005 [Streptomyces sp. YC537]|uniref:CARDB domain-containing protein n=1 Tax=Streptomyces boluensis TaxID=1775135 RepID=A0A964UY39_9ACTN|nr:hypothetical protein [Streptomyces boluensis]